MIPPDTGAGLEQRPAWSHFAEARENQMNTGEQRNPTEFEKELTALINKHSYEQHSDTPDFILAEYLRNCLRCFNRAVQEREKHYGRSPYGGAVPVTAPDEVPVDTPPHDNVARTIGGEHLASECDGRSYPVGTRVALTHAPNVMMLGLQGTIVACGNNGWHTIQWDADIRPFADPHYNDREFRVIETQPKE